MSIENVTQSIQAGTRNITHVVWFLGEATRNDVLCANESLISTLNSLFKSLVDAELFATNFPDEAILAYRGKNGLPLGKNHRYRRKIVQPDISDGQLIVKRKHALRKMLIKSSYKAMQMLCREDNLQSMLENHPDTYYLDSLLQLYNTLRHISSTPEIHDLAWQQGGLAKALEKVYQEIEKSSLEQKAAKPQTPS